MTNVEGIEAYLKHCLDSTVIGLVVQHLLTSEDFPRNYHYEVAQSILQGERVKDEYISIGEVGSIFNEQVEQPYRLFQHFIGALVYAFTYHSEKIEEEVSTTSNEEIVAFYEKAKALTTSFWVYDYLASEK